MKILHLIQKCQYRGVEIFTSQLCNHLVEQGHTVIIVAIFKGEAALPFNGKILKLNASGSRRFIDSRNWKKISNIIKDFEPDIVQANAGDTLKYAVLSKLFFKWTSPIISRNASEVGRYLKNPLQKKLNIFLYKNVDYVISVSKVSERDILNHFPFLKGRTRVIPVGLEPLTHIENVLLKPENCNHIIHVGGFTFEKNHEGLLRIFKKVANSVSNIHLHLIGDGPLKSKIKEIVKKNGLTPKVTFHGYVDKPLPFIKAADILVLPSIIEGLPAVILEAMYCETSVIAYDVGGIKEVVNPGETGYLINKNDEINFVKTLLGKLNKPNEDQYFKKKAKQLVTEKFSNKYITVQFINCYKDISEKSDSSVFKSKLKILQLVTRRQYRGAELFAADLSEELLKLGHEIAFVGIYESKDDILRVPGADNRDLIKDKRYPFSITVTKNLIKLLKEIKPDVVQCNGSDTLKYMYAASYFVEDIPILYRNISIISEWVSSDCKKLLYKKMFNKIAYVTSVGEEAMVDFIKTYNYPATRTEVIRRGIPIKKVDKITFDKNFKKNIGLPSNAKIAVHIGNFSPEKNHEFLIDIFDEIKKNHPEIKLICVGNGILFEKFNKLINQKGLQNSIFLLGFRKDIPEILAVADCLVLCSKVEGVPGVILEAGTQKTPAIATNVGGVKEALIDGKTGFLINNFDKEEFRERLVQLMMDDDLRARFGENAYGMISKGYDPRLNARKFEKLYQRLIKEKLTI